MRYDYTEKEKEKVFLNFMKQGKVKQTPASEKKKYILLKEIVLERFEEGKIYSEKDINSELKSIFSDSEYVEQRRYLIIFELFDRTKDGAEYWMKSIS